MALAVSVLGACAAAGWHLRTYTPHTTGTGKAAEEEKAWNYEKMKELVKDVRLPAMVVDLDVFDANIR